MTIKATTPEVDYANAQYHRDYTNGIEPQKTLITRIALATSPFFALHPALKIPVALTMDALCVRKSTGFQQSCAIVSLAFTIFNFQICTSLTTAVDIILELRALSSSKNKWEAMHHAIKISNHLLFLALRARGGIELYFISCAMNAVVSLLGTFKEFKEKRWIEGTAHLLMTAIRLHQMSAPWTHLNQKWEIKKIVRKFIANLTQTNILNPSNQISASIRDRSDYGNSKLISEIFIKRHSGENFDPRPLNPEQISALIEATRRTPSSYNDQPWNFILCNRETHPEAYEKVIESIYGQEWVEKAPLLVVSVVRPEFRYNQKPNEWASYDTGAAALSMSLQATDLGLMAHQIGGFDPESIQKDFNLPQGYKPITIIAIGYEQKCSNSNQESPSERLDPKNNFFFGDWGQATVSPQQRIQG